MTDYFIECDTCHKKLGSPVLCDGCLSNRDLIEALKKQIAELEKSARPLDPGGIIRYEIPAEATTGDVFIFNPSDWPGDEDPV